MKANYSVVNRSCRERLPSYGRQRRGPTTFNISAMVTIDWIQLLHKCTYWKEEYRTTFTTAWLENTSTAFPLNQSLVCCILVFNACTQYISKLSRRTKKYWLFKNLKTRSMAQCTSRLSLKAIMESHSNLLLEWHGYWEALFLMIINLFMTFPSLCSLQNQN